VSQHIVDALSVEHTVMVGYDRPLDNFFGTVFDGTLDGDVIHWCPGELTPERMAENIAAFAIVPPALIAQLRDEQANRATHPTHKFVDHRTTQS